MEEKKLLRTKFLNLHDFNMKDWDGIIKVFFVPIIILNILSLMYSITNSTLGMSSYFLVAIIALYNHYIRIKKSLLTYFFLINIAVLPIAAYVFDCSDLYFLFIQNNFGDILYLITTIYIFAYIVGTILIDTIRFIKKANKAT